LNVDSTNGVNFGTAYINGSFGALKFQARDGSNNNTSCPILYSPLNKDFRINDGQGTDIVSFQTGIGTTSGGFVASSVQGTYNVGFSNQRTGQVGYHLYNGGGAQEWIMYQPAGGTGHDLRIAKGAAGAMVDVMRFGTDGNTYAQASMGILGAELWLGSGAGVTTGVLRFAGGGAGSTNYLWYDGTQFQLSKSLSVGGNITSSSDVRLKSDIRELRNSIDLVRQLQPKRFTMYGKSDFGFIAQDALPVVPEVVAVDSKGYMSIDYGRLTAVLAGAIKNLDERLTRAGL
jgi:hypothetical protein